MMSRQGRACGVPEGVGSGIQAIEIDTQRELRQLQYRMEAMEKINSESIDTSNEEESFEEEKQEIADEVKVLKMLMKSSNRTEVEFAMYEGNLNVEELMDRINVLNKYFEFEEIEDKKKRNVPLPK